MVACSNWCVVHVWWYVPIIIGVFMCGCMFQFVCCFVYGCMFQLVCSSFMVACSNWCVVRVAGFRTLVTHAT